MHCRTDPRTVYTTHTRLQKKKEVRRHPLFQSNFNKSNHCSAIPFACNYNIKLIEIIKSKCENQLNDKFHNFTPIFESVCAHSFKMESFPIFQFFCCCCDCFLLHLLQHVRDTPNHWIDFHKTDELVFVILCVACWKTKSYKQTELTHN